MGDATMIDTSVFGALNRANSGPEVAKDLLELLNRGDNLVVCASTYQEILRTPDPVLRASQLQQISDFKMTIQQASMADRADLYVDYANATVDRAGEAFKLQQAGVELKDLPLVGDVRAYMKVAGNQKVKFFTLDRMVKNKGTITKNYGIEFSERSRYMTNLGDRVSYDPEALGVAAPPKNVPVADEVPPITPEVALPKPGPGSTRMFMDAAKAGFKAGLRSLVSAETIVGVAATLLLAYADKAAAQEARKTIQVKFIKEGFAKGVAAGVMGWTEQEVMSNAMNRVTHFRVQGLEDPAGFLTLSYILKLAEIYENYAVGFGYYFASSKSLQWKERIRTEGFDRLKQYGYTRFGTNPDVLFEYDFIATLAWALRRTTDAIVEPMIRWHHPVPERKFPTGGRNAA
jgi:hypothetical protein